MAVQYRSYVLSQALSSAAPALCSAAQALRSSIADILCHTLSCGPVVSSTLSPTCVEVSHLRSSIADMLPHFTHCTDPCCGPESLTSGAIIPYAVEYRCRLLYSLAHLCCALPPGGPASQTCCVAFSSHVMPQRCTRTVHIHSAVQYRRHLGPQYLLRASIAVVCCTFSHTCAGSRPARLLEYLTGAALQG